MFLNCSTCFGRHTAHHQELKNCNCSLWFYIRFWLPAAAMAEPKHVEQLRYIGIINTTTQLHLVGSFYEIYISIFILVQWIIDIHQIASILSLCIRVAKTDFPSRINTVTPESPWQILSQLLQPTGNLDCLNHCISSSSSILCGLH